MVPHFEDLAQNEQVLGVFFLQDARMPTFSGVSKVIKIVPNVLFYCGLRIVVIGQIESLLHCRLVILSSFYPHFSNVLSIYHYKSHPFVIVRVHYADCDFAKDNKHKCNFSNTF